MKNQIENNKLIAEFMGLIVASREEYHSSLHTNVDADLKYHTSWNWLMPVVSKCREESNAEDSHWEAIYYSLEECDRDVTYKAVVEFIKWYNDQNRFICGSCGEHCNSYEYNEETDVDECPDCRIKNK